MKITIYTLLFLFFITTSFSQGFKNEQLRYPRVRTAYSNKYQFIDSLFKTKGVNLSSCKVFIRAFKFEEILEVWAKNPGDSIFTHIKDYKFCASSGVLGPKRKQGDGQIPEGIYYINKFNAWSGFHLALGINYPNKSDIILGDKTDPGNLIFIHGKCCTIGCIPITDDKIEELYIICVEAKNANQKEIPVHIFPFRFTDKRINWLNNNYNGDETLISFWNNLKDIYLNFEHTHNIFKINIDSNGNYIIDTNTKE
ncbi:MAG: murein L,D-transpeptidase [Marinilabiliales bacterium]